MESAIASSNLSLAARDNCFRRACTEALSELPRLAITADRMFSEPHHFPFAALAPSMPGFRGRGNVMLDNAIPVKTEAGRAEVGDRRLKLGPRHRMVLISINGESSVADIRQQFRSINELDGVLSELFESGLIEVPGASLANIANAAVEPVAAAAPVRAPTAPTPAPAVAQTDYALQAAREFMTKTVASKLGLRSFMFTLRIEKCYSRDELRELLPEFRRVLRKAVDAAGVAEFSARAEQLIAER